MPRLRLLLAATVIVLALPAAAQAAVTPTVSSGTLSIVGDGLDDRVALRLAPGAPNTLQIDVGDDGSANFTFDRATFTAISIRPGAGNDLVRLDESNGAFSTAQKTSVRAGLGNDVVVGASGDEQLLGEDGDDQLTPGPGTDMVIGGSGNDTVTWQAGDGADVFQAQSGSDVLRLVGSDTHEHLALEPNSLRVRVLHDGTDAVDAGSLERVFALPQRGVDTLAVGDLEATTLDRIDADLGADGAFDHVRAAGTAGNDSINVVGQAPIASVSGLPTIFNVHNVEARDQLTIESGPGFDKVDAAALPPILSLTVDGGDGSDEIIGTPARDTLLGGPGLDKITAGQGLDTLLMGSEDDTAFWSAGDGDDVIEGHAGHDQLRMTGSGASELIRVQADGERVSVQRSVSGRLDLDGVETVEANTVGGSDTITVGDMTGTAVKIVSGRFGAVPGGNSADGAPDRIVVEGTPGPDDVRVSGLNGVLDAIGLQARIFMAGADPGLDRLTVRGGDDEDEIDARQMLAGSPALTLEGGAGDDLLLGGPGNDGFAGQAGDDLIFGGAGDDVFGWLADEGSDIIEGQAGSDTLLMTGSAAAERFKAMALGQRVQITRDIGNVRLDFDDIERVAVTPAHGADVAELTDLSGTEVTSFTYDLAPIPGAGFGDDAADLVRVQGSSGDDQIAVAAVGGEVRMTGLPTPLVTVRGSDGPSDSLRLDTRNGNDTTTIGSGVQQLISFGLGS